MRVAGDCPKLGEDCNGLVAGSSRVGFTDAEGGNRDGGVGEGDEYSAQEGEE